MGLGYAQDRLAFMGCKTSLDDKAGTVVTLSVILGSLLSCIIW